MAARSSKKKAPAGEPEQAPAPKAPAKKRTRKAPQTVQDDALAALEKAVVERDATITGLEAALGEQKTALERSETERLRLSRRVEELEDHAEQQAEEVGALLARVADSEKQLTESAARLAEAQGRLAAWEGGPSPETAKAHADLLRLAGDRVARLEAALAEATGRASSLTEALAAAEERHREREAAFEVLSRQLEAASARAALFEEAAAEGGQALLSLEQEVASLRARLEGLREAG